MSRGPPERRCLLRTRGRSRVRRCRIVKGYEDGLVRYAALIAAAK